MSCKQWGAPGVSPFFTERARTRAPQILSYAAVGGAALLVAPSGEVVMTSGSLTGVDLGRVTRLARGAVSASRSSFKLGSACVHTRPITAGWTLCVISSEIAPRVVLERLERASAVMALALVDGGSARSSGGGSAPSGSPAEVAAPTPPRMH